MTYVTSAELQRLHETLAIIAGPCLSNPYLSESVSMGPIRVSEMMEGGPYGERISM
jgi:hypothetical protein